MSFELLVLGGYGQFVWPAFIFTFLSFSILYLKTNKEFKKQEKIFLKEYKHLQYKEIETTGKKEVLSRNPIF